MKDGNYWINDTTRYGWEVVRVIDNRVYRFGIEGGFAVGATDFYGMPFVPVSPPNEGEE